MCAALFLAAVALAAASKRPSTRDLFWPDEFSMSFVTATNSSFASFGQLSFSRKFDATRIDHSAGAYECMHFYNTTSACTLFMSAAGLSRVLHRTGDCCVDNPSIHSTDGRWMINSTFVGVTTVAERPCNVWNGEHVYLSDVATNRPCAFTFPPAPPQNYQFLFHTWNATPKLTSQFMNPPAGCTTLCSAQ